MADHVTVDTDRLRDTANALEEVAALLRSASSDVRSDSAALAQRDLVQAMDIFVGNWRVHRERLIEAVDGHRRWVEGAAEAYETSDRDMAAAIDSSRSHAE